MAYGILPECCLFFFFLFFRSHNVPSCASPPAQLGRTGDERDGLVILSNNTVVRAQGRHCTSKVIGATQSSYQSTCWSWSKSLPGRKTRRWDGGEREKWLCYRPLSSLSIRSDTYLFICRRSSLPRCLSFFFFFSFSTYQSGSSSFRLFSRALIIFFLLFFPIDFFFFWALHLHEKNSFIFFFLCFYIILLLPFFNSFLTATTSTK